MPKEIKTLTPEEAVERLRERGMKISPETIRRGLEQGVFSFGDAIQTSDRSCRYLIYERLFTEWMAERMEAVSCG